MAIPDDDSNISPKKLNKLRESIYAWATREYKRDEGGKFSETDSKGSGKSKPQAKKAAKKVDKQRELRDQRTSNRNLGKSLLAGVKSDLTPEEKQAGKKSDKSGFAEKAPEFKLEDSVGSEKKSDGKQTAAGAAGEPPDENSTPKPKTELAPDNLRDTPEADIGHLKAIGWGDDEIRGMSPENLKAAVVTAKLAHAAEELQAAEKAASGKIEDLPPSNDPFEQLAGVPAMSPDEAGAFGEQSLSPKERARAEKLRARAEKNGQKEHARQAKIALKLKMFAEKAETKAILANLKASTNQHVADLNAAEAAPAQEHEANLKQQDANLKDAHAQDKQNADTDSMVRDTAAESDKAAGNALEKTAEGGKKAFEKGKDADQAEATALNKGMDKDQKVKDKEFSKDEAEAHKTNKAIDKDEKNKKAEEASVKAESKASEDEKFKKVADDAVRDKADDEAEAHKVNKAIDKDEKNKKKEVDADHSEAVKVNKAIDKDEANKKKAEKKDYDKAVAEGDKAFKKIDKDEKKAKAADEKEAHAVNKAIDRDDKNKKKAAEKDKKTKESAHKENERRDAKANKAQAKETMAKLKAHAKEHVAKLKAQAKIDKAEEAAHGEDNKRTSKKAAQDQKDAEKQQKANLKAQNTTNAQNQKAATQAAKTQQQSNKAQAQADAKQAKAQAKAVKAKAKAAKKAKAARNKMIKAVGKMFGKGGGKGKAGVAGKGHAAGKGSASTGKNGKGMPAPKTLKEEKRSKKDDNKLRRAIRHLTEREPNKLLELIQKEVGESVAASASLPSANYASAVAEIPMIGPEMVVEVASLPRTYEHEECDDGTIRVKMVPIFAENVRRFGEMELRYDRSWLDGALEADIRHRITGYKAPMHFGHHANPAAGVVRERAGHIELCEVKLCLYDGKPTWVAFADLVYKDEASFERAKKDFPYRSVEISPDRPNEINSLALLSSEAPYFRFPNLAFSAETSGSRVFVWSDSTMAIDNKDAVVGGVTAPPVTATATVQPAKVEPATFAAPPPAAPLPPPPVQAAAPVAPAAPMAPPVNPMAGMEAKLDQLVQMFSGLMQALAPSDEAEDEEDSEEDGVGDESEQPVVQAAATAPAPAPAAPVTASTTDNSAKFEAAVTVTTPAPVTAVNSDEVGKLQGEIAGLKAKLESFEKSKSADVIFSTLASELENYSLGPTWRQDLKAKVEKDGEAAARAYVAGVKTSAPKLPPARMPEAAPDSQDSPEVAKYAVRGPDVLAKARHFSAIYDHIQKTKGFSAFSGQARDKFIEAQFLMEGN